MCVLIAVFVIQRAQGLVDGISVETDVPSTSMQNGDVYWKRMMAGFVCKLKEDALEGMFHDEHVYKLVAVVLDCLQDGLIDNKMAYLAIRKVTQHSLIVTGRSSGINADQDNHPSAPQRAGGSDIDMAL